MRNILLVDDEQDILEIIEGSLLFIDDGFLIHKASTIPHAIEILSSKNIDLIISDFNLKTSCVTELIEWIKNSSKIFNLCIMSGYLPDLDKIDYSQKIYTLEKPFDEEELENLIQKLT